MLTNNPQLVRDLTVKNDFLLCKSDTFPVFFNIKSNVRRKKAPKREIYNFKHAKWEAINEELRFTDWNSVLFTNDIEAAWNTFKNIIY